MTTKWRGAQCAPNVTEDNIIALMVTDANIVRYQFNPNYWEDSLQILDMVIAVAAHRNKKVTLDIHQPLSGENPVTNELHRTGFIQMWVTLVDRYKNNNALFAYGILNEPSGSGQAVNRLMREVYDEIRKIDADKRIIVTCPHSDPTQFYKIKLLDDIFVWYEVHMYLPMKLTHQGITGNLYPKNYPGNGWSKKFLKDKLQHVRNFQQQHKARIYVGEFGISTYAPNSARREYMQDCISIFEEYKWNWTYHAWREAAVWDVENYPDVYTVIENGWSKNG